MDGRLQNCFIARPLSLFQQSNSNQPHQRIEPEQRFHYHMNRGGQVVAPSGVTQLVCENRLELSRCEMFGDALREDKDLPEDPKYPRLHAQRCAHRWYRQTELQWRCHSQGCSDAPPMPPPCQAL